MFDVQVGASKMLGSSLYVTSVVSTLYWLVLRMQPLGPKGPSYPEMGKEEVGKALQDAKLSFEAVEAAVSGGLKADWGMLDLSIL